MKDRGERLGGVLLLVLVGCCQSTDPGRRGKCGRAESAPSAVERQESRWESRKFGLTEALLTLYRH